MCFEALREKNILKVFQKDEMNNRDLIIQQQEKIKEIEDINLQEGLGTQYKAKQQYINSLIKDYVVIEREKYRIQKYRRGFMIREAYQIDEKIYIQSTKKGKQELILIINGFNFVAQKNNRIQQQTKQIESNVKQNLVKFLDYKSDSPLNWEDKTCQYRLVLIPKNIDSYMKKNEEIDPQVIKSNLEFIYALYTNSIPLTIKILNYVYIYNKKDKLKQVNDCLKDAAKLFSYYLASSLLKKIGAFTKKLPQSSKLNNQVQNKDIEINKISVVEEIYINSPSRVRGESVTLNQQSGKEFNFNCITKEQSNSSINSLNTSNSSILLAKKPGQEKQIVANLLEIEEQQIEQEIDGSIIPQKDRNLLKKSSLILKKVEMEENNLNIIKNEEVKEDINDPIIDTQNMQSSAISIQNSLMPKKKDSIDSDGKYTTEIIKYTQPESPVIKIKKVKDQINQYQSKDQYSSEKANIGVIQLNQTDQAPKPSLNDQQNEDQENVEEKQELKKGETALKQFKIQSDQIAKKKQEIQEKKNFINESNNNTLIPHNDLRDSGKIVKIMQTQQEVDQQNQNQQYNNSDFAVMKELVEEIKSNGQVFENNEIELKNQLVDESKLITFNQIPNEQNISGEFLKIKDIIATQDPKSEFKYEESREKQMILLGYNSKKSNNSQQDIKEVRNAATQDDSTPSKKIQENHQYSPNQQKQTDINSIQRKQSDKYQENFYNRVNSLKESQQRSQANPKRYNSQQIPKKGGQQNAQIINESKVDSQLQNKNDQKQEILNNHLTDKQELTLSPIQLFNIGGSYSQKKYIISKIAIHWFKEEPFNNFYSEVKDIVIGDNVISLYDLAFKYSQMKDSIKDSNCWTIKTNININEEDDQQKIVNQNKAQSNSPVKINFPSSPIQQQRSKLGNKIWKIAVRNERGIDIVNGELNISDSLQSCTEYGREQFLLMTSPFASLNQSLYAILHIVIDQKEDQLENDMSQTTNFQMQIIQDELVLQGLSLKKSFYQNLSQIICNEEKFFYYLIPNKYVIIPKRYIWIQFLNDPEINHILEYYPIAQKDQEKLEMIDLCRQKLEKLIQQRTQNILDWQEKMQTEVLMNTIRKQSFDQILSKNNQQTIQQHMISKGIHHQYRLHIYSNIIDLYNILHKSKQQQEDIFQKPCVNVVEFLQIESKQFCNPLIISVSSLITSKFLYQTEKSRQIFNIYRSYLMYNQIMKDKQSIAFNSSTINLLINVYEHFLQEEQLSLPWNIQFSSKPPKFQLSISDQQIKNKKQPFQQFDEQIFFTFTSLMSQLEEIDPNFIFQSTIYRLSQIYPDIDLSLQIANLLDLIFEGSFSYFSNVLIGELWNRLIDCVFIQLQDIQKIDVNFFMFCASLTIISIYIDSQQQDIIQGSFVMGDSIDELIQEFYCTFLNFNQFIEIFYSTQKSEMITYKKTSAHYQDYITKVKIVNGNGVYRQKWNKKNQQEQATTEFQHQLDFELQKLNKCEENIIKSHKYPQEVEMFIFLNEIFPQILQTSTLTIQYQKVKIQKFVPLQQTSKGLNLQTSFKARIPFLNTKTIYAESDSKEIITFELIVQVSQNSIYFQGTVQWDPVDLLYKKKIVYLHQKNDSSSTIDIDKTLVISIYLEPVSHVSQQINKPQNKSQGIIQEKVDEFYPPIYINEGTSLVIYRYDIQNQMMHHITTQIDPLKVGFQNSDNTFVQNQTTQKKSSQDSINDWLSKISYLISNSPQLSIDEKLKLLYLTMKSAFGNELSIKNVLLLYKEIARIEGIFIEFENLILRASQILGKSIRNRTVISINFINNEILKKIQNNKDHIKNQPIEITSSTLEKEYKDVLNQKLVEAIHIVDIRNIISQVHKNILLRNKINANNEANLIKKYQLIMNINGVTYDYIVDESGTIVLTKMQQEQQIIITKIHTFQNIFMDQNAFFAILTSSNFLLDYFCRYPQIQFFTRQLPIVLCVSYYDNKNKQVYKSDLLHNFSIVDPISFIIESVIQMNLPQKIFNSNTIKCFYKKQQLFLNDNLINQINMQSLKVTTKNQIYIQIDLFESEEVLIKKPHSQIALSRIQQFIQSDEPKNIIQFQAVVFTNNGIQFENLNKLPMNDIYSLQNIQFHISPQNLHII